MYFSGYGNGNGTSTPKPSGMLLTPKVQLTSGQKAQKKYLSFPYQKCLCKLCGQVFASNSTSKAAKPSPCLLCQFWSHQNLWTPTLLSWTTLTLPVGLWYHDPKRHKTTLSNCHMLTFTLAHYWSDCSGIDSRPASSLERLLPLQERCNCCDKTIMKGG